MIHLILRSNGKLAGCSPALLSVGLWRGGGPVIIFSAGTHQLPPPLLRSALLELALRCSPVDFSLCGSFAALPARCAHCAVGIRSAQNWGAFVCWRNAHAILVI